VEKGQGVAQLHSVPQDLRLNQRAAGRSFQDAIQAVAGYQFHRQVAVASILKRLVVAGQVRVVQIFQNRKLGGKAADLLRVKRLF
jgi:hypothetical protein